MAADPKNERLREFLHVFRDAQNSADAKEVIAELARLIQQNNESAPIPGPTKEALNEFLRLNQETATMEYYESELADLALSYEAHKRQVYLLLWSHAPLLVAILVFAAVGGHVHTVQTVFCVYLGLFVAFVAAVVVLGLQTRRSWMPRAFSLALLALSVWSVISVIYAIYMQPRMRLWYDITLVCLQAVDVLITVFYFYTNEMLACVGGEASALVSKMHHDRVMNSPIAEDLGDAATANYYATRPSALKTIVGAIAGFINGDPRVRRKQA